MNIYDKAYELARAIRESDELKELKSLNERIAADADSKRMLDDFRKRQQELQERMMKGEMPSQDEMQKMEKLFDVINLNPSLKKLFESERRLGVMMNDIQRIIMAPLEEVLK
jgi:cell fate (sporulation/competence/biofilm development) regulator YlbF (YheA/YmcA/DUF963 family)